MYRAGHTSPIPNMVSVHHKQIGWVAEDYGTSAPASGGYETSNACAYFPLKIPSTCTVRRLWWANGGGVSASYNIDVGIYADSGYGPGARIVSSGSTAQGTASQVQFVDVTDTTLAPGLYWLAIAASSNAAEILRVSAVTAIDACYRFEQVTFPLPSSATPVEASVNFVYLFGFATTASP